MMTTADYLDALRAKFDVDSDAAAARIIGITHRQQVSRYRQMHSTFDDEVCPKLAAALGMKPEIVLLDMHHQREKNAEVRALWERIARLATDHKALAASIMCLGVALIMSASNEAANHAQMLVIAGFTSVRSLFDSNIHYALENWSVFLCLFALILAAFPRHTGRKKKLGGDNLE